MRNKSQLRSQLREQRRALSTAQQQLAATQLANLFIASKLDQHTKIALYLSNDGEIAPNQICQHLWQQKNVQVFLPRIAGAQMHFAHYDRDTRLQENQYGLLEPCPATHPEQLSADSLDLILLPLVGFDIAGNRIGMGGGYYDRALAITPKPRLIGLAHECQKLNAIHSDQWDIPLDGILTAERFYQSR